MIISRKEKVFLKIDKWDIISITLFYLEQKICVVFLVNNIEIRRIRHRSETQRKLLGPQKGYLYTFPNMKGNVHKY